MKDALIFFSIALVCGMLYMHKMLINDMQERGEWQESVTFDRAMCPKG